MTFVTGISDPPRGGNILSLSLLRELFNKCRSDFQIRVIIAIYSKTPSKSTVMFLREAIDKLGKDRVKVLFLPPLQGKLIPIRKIMLNFFRNYLKTDSKILFIMTENIHTYYPLLNFPFCRKKVIFWMQSTPFSCAPPYVFQKGGKAVLSYIRSHGGITKLLEYFFYNFCLMTLRGRAIVTNPGMINALSGVHLFRNFSFEALRHQSIQYNFLSSNKKSFDAAYLATYIPGKGLEDCLRIWKLVTREDKTYKLIVIGPPEKLTEQLSKKLDISDNVISVGEMYDEKRKRQLLLQSKLFIYPSVMDSYSLSIAEALSTSLPVICYDITPFIENFSDTKSVIRIKLKNYQEAASVIIRLLKDHGYRENLSFEALEYAKRFFTPDEFTSNFLKALMSLISQMRARIKKQIG